jgi:lysophospholipase L1-like esterase
LGEKLKKEREAKIKQKKKGNSITKEAEEMMGKVLELLSRQVIGEGEIETGDFMEPIDMGKLDVLVVGDSVVRKIEGKLKGKKVEVIGLSGKKLDEIVIQVLKETGRVKKDGCLVIQGGGNGLEKLGVEGNRKIILALLDKVKENFPTVKVAFIPVIPRITEGQCYDEMRKELNRIIRPEIYRKGMNSIELGEGSQWDGFLSEDGVHLNHRGVAAMVREINRWIGVMTEGYHHGRQAL